LGLHLAVMCLLNTLGLHLAVMCLLNTLGLHLAVMCLLNTLGLHLYVSRPQDGEVIEPALLLPSENFTWRNLNDHNKERICRFYELRHVVSIHYNSLADCCFFAFVPVSFVFTVRHLQPRLLLTVPYSDTIKNRTHTSVASDRKYIVSMNKTAAINERSKLLYWCKATDAGGLGPWSHVLLTSSSNWCFLADYLIPYLLILRNRLNFPI
jgi:hypothetical protein